jgi:RNA polymerase sigma-70 factor (ECF subfamily)
MSPEGGKAPPVDPGFRRVFDEEFSYVRRTLRRFGARERDVEDLAHDVFLAAHLAYAEFDRARPIKPWLCGIAFRVASHHRRRPAHQREVLDVEPIDEPDSRPLADEQLDDARRRRIVLTLLDKLDLERRAVLVMHDLDGMPMREVAEVLGIAMFTG